MGRGTPVMVRVRGARRAGEGGARAGADAASSAVSVAVPGRASERMQRGASPARPCTLACAWREATEKGLGQFGLIGSVGCGTGERPLLPKQGRRPRVRRRWLVLRGSRRLHAVARLVGSPTGPSGSWRAVSVAHVPMAAKPRRCLREGEGTVWLRAGRE